MKTKGTEATIKIALALIVKPGESELLYRALQNASPVCDGIFITITGKDKQIDKVCNKFKNCFVSYYEWDFNFSNARNFNFNQVPKEYKYILWMDTDDMFRDIDKLPEIIENNPGVDIFTMNYAYWWDEWKNPIVVHLKSQVIKNDKCVVWAGALHEDFKPNRELVIKHIKTVERLHLSTNKRFEIAKQRNLEVSEKDLAKNPDDPRSYWNLGNSQKGIGLDIQAVKTFDIFLKMSKSEEEKYIVLLRIAEINLSKKQYNLALDTVKMAIGTKPEYPDAYHLMGSIYSEMGDFVKARDMFLLGLKKPIPQYQIIVYNPREYDYFPLKKLARAYIELMLPSLAYEALKACLKICPNDEQLKLLVSVIKKETAKFNKTVKEVERLQKIKNKDELKKELELLPEEIMAHPSVCNLRNINFIKNTSSGKDVAIYCGYTDEVWNPEIVKGKGIGGSEEAVINLSKEWAKNGWKVEVYNNCGNQVKTYDGVKYKPYWMFNYNDRQDIIIFWRNVRMLDHPLNAEKIFLDLHDVMAEGELNEERLKKVYKIMVKSKAHRKLFPNVPDEKFCIIPNGVDISLFEKEEKRNPYYLVNFSSPDRSLKALLDIYKEVLLRLSPDIRRKVRLAWYYGWDLFDRFKMDIESKEWKETVQRKFKELGVEGGFRINHEQVAKENLKAGALIYPSQFYEIDWIGGSKAQIAGCVPITSNYAAIGEKVKYGIKVDVSDLETKTGFDFSISNPLKKEMFVNAILDYLKNAEKWDKQRTEMAIWAQQEFDIKRIADLWVQEFNLIKIEKPCQILTT